MSTEYQTLSPLRFQIPATRLVTDYKGKKTINFHNAARRYSARVFFREILGCGELLYFNKVLSVNLTPKLA